MFRLQRNTSQTTNSRVVFGLDPVLQASLGSPALGGGGMEGAGSRRQASEAFTDNKVQKVLTLFHNARAKICMSLPCVHYHKGLRKIMDLCRTVVAVFVTPRRRTYRVR